MVIMLRIPALNTLAGWLIFSGLTTVPAWAQTPARRSQVNVTQLLVLEWGFAQTNRYVVTADSLWVEFTMGTDEGTQRTHYTRALTLNERNRLLAPFDQLYLSRLRPLYEGVSDITDGYNYDLSIRKGEYLKETRLIDYSLGPMLTFSHRLNALLPPAFRLSYGQP